MTQRVCFCSLAVLLLAVGCDAPVATKPDSAKPTPVRAVAVAETDVPRTTLQPATVHAFYRSEVRANASGYVESLQADIGDVVKAGDALAVIAVPEMEKQRAIIEARIAKLQAEEQRYRAGVRLSEAMVTSATAKLAEAKSEIARADASLAAAESEYVRTRDLVENKSLQARMLDEALKRRDSERAGRDAMLSSIASAEAQVTVAEAQKNSADADLAASEAETEIAKRQLEELDVLMAYATIRSPLSGVVTARHLEPGDLVGPNREMKSAALFVVSQVDKVRVRIPVPENDAPLVDRGDVVTLTLPSFSSEAPVTGTVSRISGSLDPSTRTMLVEAEIENPDGKLIPGMFGQASIELSTQVAANTLPSRAVRFDETGNAYVYVIGDDDAVTVTSVTTGLDDGNVIEIVDGLSSGQRVIDGHLKRFADGEKVAVLWD